MLRARCIRLARALPPSSAPRPTDIRFSRSGSTPSSARRTIRSITRCSSQRVIRPMMTMRRSENGVPMKELANRAACSLLVQS